MRFRTTGTVSVRYPWNAQEDGVSLPLDTTAHCFRDESHDNRCLSVRQLQSEFPAANRSEQPASRVVYRTMTSLTILAARGRARFHCARFHFAGGLPANGASFLNQIRNARYTPAGAKGKTSRSIALFQSRERQAAKHATTALAR